MSIARAMRWVWLLALVALVGCAGIRGRFRAEKAPGYQGKLGRALIIPYNEELIADLGASFSRRLLERTMALLQQKGIQTEVTHLDEKSMDADAPVRAAITRFRPDQLLQISIRRLYTSNSVTGGGYLPRFNSTTHAAFTFSVVDVASDSTVWRGELVFEVHPDPETIADQLVEQLGAAGFF